MTKQPATPGIVRKDGRYVMLCGQNEVPVRIVDKDGKERK